MSTLKNIGALFAKKGEELFLDGVETSKKLFDVTKEKVKQELTDQTNKNKDVIDSLINKLDNVKEYLETVKESKIVTVKKTERKLWWYDFTPDIKLIVKDSSTDWDVTAGVKVPKENVYDVVSGSHKGKKIMKEDCI